MAAVRPAGPEPMMMTLRVLDTAATPLKVNCKFELHKGPSRPGVLAW
jgi:hypothetical protein